MDTGYKSVAVDHETWEILQVWSNQEYRTISGQIRMLVNKHLPTRLRKANEQLTPIKKKPKGNKLGRVKLGHTNRRLASGSQLFQVINAISKMEQPLTNFELADLLDGELTLQQCVKRTSYAWGVGLLSREATSNGHPGRFIYSLTKAGKRHLNRAI